MTYTAKSIHIKQAMAARKTNPVQAAEQCFKK